MRDAATALLRAIADGAGAAPEVMETRTTGWSSATFAGARHRLVIRLPHPAAAQLARLVAGDSLCPRGHLVAELGMVRRREAGAEVMEIDALTVEEG